MKIAVIGLRGIPSCYGGIEKHCEEVYTRLASLGHKITIFTRKRFINPDYTPPKNIKLKSVWTIESKFLGTPLHSFFSTLMCIFSDYDIIHFHAQGPCLFAWLPKLFAPGKKLVFTCHGIDWRRNKWNLIAKSMIQLGEVLSARLFDMQIVVSDELEYYYRHKYNKCTVKITNGSNIYEKVKPKIINKRFGLGEKDYILSIGRLVPEKGYHKLIEAYKHIKTDKKLVFTGGSASTNGYVKYLKRIAQDDKRIIFTGNLEGTELREIYSNTYLYLSASTLEGLPLTLLEAMSYGIPALVSDIPPHVEVIGEFEEYGFLFNNNEMEKVVAKLDHVLCLPEEKLEEKGIKGLNKIKQHHCWEMISKKHEMAYRATR